MISIGFLTNIPFLLPTCKLERVA